ncbi:type IV toxin-antitoxin system AbiEi family antitoxin domain-containing protein [Pararobbsia alpina]|uniref:type IV toxin-antitoxin system AbiEi family antitoxin domain-containing protein n=1 Tax=Pararobbsia alpina TaxID=621374 RepID=UPI0039A6545F
MKARYCFETEEFEALTGREPGGAAGKSALLRLNTQGLVVPLARRSGFWLIVPPEHISKGAPPVAWWLHDYLSRKEVTYHVGLLSAATAHGSSHFAVMETQIFLPLPRRELQVAPFRLRFFVKQGIADAPTVTLRTEKSKVVVSSVATTLLDLIRHAPTVGGIERANLILQDLGEKLANEDIALSLAAAADIAAAQRFGYLLEHAAYKKHAQRVAYWLNEKRVQRTRLDVSGTSSKGDVSERWKVLINTDLASVA